MIIFIAAGIAALWAIGYLFCYGVIRSEFDDDFFIANVFHITVVAAVISFQLTRLTCDSEGMGYRYLGERVNVSVGLGVLMWLGMFALLLVVSFLLLPAFLKVVAHVEDAREIGSFVCVVVLTLYTSVFSAILMMYPGALGYEKIPKEEQQTVEETSISSADLEDEGR